MTPWLPSEPDTEGTLIPSRPSREMATFAGAVAAPRERDADRERRDGRREDRAGTAG